MNAKKIISIITASAIITAAELSTTAIKEENNLLISSAALSYENPELAEYAKQVAILVNRERSSYGLQPVKYSPLLSEAANVRSSELRKNFSHTRPNGTSCFTVLKEFDISYFSAAENIAYGQRTPEIVMNAWMNSSGHRANILSKNVEYIGVGVVYSNGIYYWTQLFASSDSISDAYLPEENNKIPISTTNKAEITITTTATVTTPTTQFTTLIQSTSKATKNITHNTQTSSTKPLASTSQTTVTNETISKSTTETTVTNTPAFTLPDLSDYFNPDNENIIISPEHFDIYDFLLNNEICIDKCCRNAKDNFTEFYTNLKDKILENF
ncbi:MAG: hypothetical protein IJN43_15475 [Ruminococcus sp.]|nr:hypothetical protein [Ruminococcus sp.]